MGSEVALSTWHVTATRLEMITVIQMFLNEKRVISGCRKNVNHWDMWSRKQRTNHFGGGE